jgi:hypothetical protein
MQETIDINKPLLKSESGLLVDPSVIENNQKQLIKTSADQAIEKYNTTFKTRSEAPIPNVRVPYNNILTRAVPVKTKEYTESGLLLDSASMDVRMARKLEVMSEAVSDEQEVLLKGPYVKDGIELEEGDIVKLNFSRYKSVQEGQHSEVIVGYEIPLYTIDGNQYLLLDARDIQYVIPKNK